MMILKKSHNMINFMIDNINKTEILMKEILNMKDIHSKIETHIQIETFNLREIINMIGTLIIMIIIHIIDKDLIIDLMHKNRIVN